MIKYYFTTFGDVYAGYEIFEPDFPDLKIIVQADKIHRYNALDHNAKTIEIIKKFGNVFPVNAYVGSIDSSEIQYAKRVHQPNWWDDEFDRTNMFIVGAGASANCVSGLKKIPFESDTLRPPLGNGLFLPNFKEVYEKYDGVRQSLFDLQHESVNVEEFFEEEWQEVLSSNVAVMNRHINIQFYLQEILMKISCRVEKEYYDHNLFAKLANKIQKIHARNDRRHFAFVSFNQDSILEYFLTQYFHKPILSLEDYIEVNKSPFCVFKPHGSWNWGWRFAERINNRINWLFSNQVDYHTLYFKLLGNLVDMVDWHGWGYELGLNEHGNGKLTINKSKIDLFNLEDIGNFYPAILLPYRDKDEFTMPVSHYEQMCSYLSVTENLFIIGWKGNEALFTRILKNKAYRLKKIVIVDPNPKIVEGHLHDVLNKPGLEEIHFKDFEDFVTNGIDKEIEAGKSIT